MKLRFLALALLATFLGGTVAVSLCSSAEAAVERAGLGERRSP
jgi:hypothetical protein